MNKEILKKFRSRLTRHRDSLIDWLRNSSRERELCLCGEDLQKCGEVISAHNEALACIEHGEFGKCRLCDGEVEVERLEMDFTTSVCLDHYSDEQLRALERDLELAAKVHRQLLPSGVPALPGIEIAAHAEPARIVGGDYFDFFTTRTNLQGFAIADVMGKGLPASMLMSNLQASLRILGPESEQLSGVALRLNELFRYNLKLIRFISLFLGAVDPQNKRITYCNAGHHPPLLWKAVDASVQWLSPTGPALGLIHDPDYQTAAVPFEPGDLLLLYTDGLVEARNGRGKSLGKRAWQIL